jgi:hypothetical protein
MKEVSCVEREIERNSTCHDCDECCAMESLSFGQLKAEHEKNFNKKLAPYKDNTRYVDAVAGSKGSVERSASRPEPPIVGHV